MILSVAILLRAPRNQIKFAMTLKIRIIVIVGKNVYSWTAHSLSALSTEPMSKWPRKWATRIFSFLEWPSTRSRLWKKEDTMLGTIITNCPKRNSASTKFKEDFSAPIIATSLKTCLTFSWSGTDFSFSLITRVISRLKIVSVKFTKWVTNFHHKEEFSKMYLLNLLNFWKNHFRRLIYEIR